MMTLRGHIPRGRLDDDGGTALTWLLGLLMMVLALGGLSLDLWRAFSERRLVAGIVDAAAIAGASGLDEQLLRDTGEVRLDPALAAQRAAASLASHSETVDNPTITVTPDGSSITVSASRQVPLTLARLIQPQGDHRVGAEATSTPRRGPP
jgi:Flp pilus assembly protein TadG